MCVTSGVRPPNPRSRAYFSTDPLQILREHERVQCEYDCKVSGLSDVRRDRDQKMGVSCVTSGVMLVSATYYSLTMAHANLSENFEIGGGQARKISFRCGEPQCIFGCSLYRIYRPLCIWDLNVRIETSYLRESVPFYSHLALAFFLEPSPYWMCAIGSAPSRHAQSSNQAHRSVWELSQVDLLPYTSQGNR